MFWQFTLNGFGAGSAYALVALGLTLQYRTLGFLNFAQGVYVVLGGYLAFWFVRAAGLPVIAAAVVSTVLVGALGGFLQVLVFSPLQRRGARSAVLLIASLGVYTAIQNVVSLVGGDDVRSLVENSSSLPIFGARLTVVQVTSICSALVLFGVFRWITGHTLWGKQLGAVGNDRELASVCGIRLRWMDCTVAAVAAGLGAIAGVVIAADVGLFPTLGFNALLMGVVAAVVGGLYTPKAALVGGVLTGLSQHLVVGFVSTRWQEAGAFIVLLGFLGFRPRGLLGKQGIFERW